MELKYVEEHTIFETIVGSRAYGIHNEDSDYDKAGVMIPGTEYFYGLNKFEQFQGYETDKVIYEIRKIIKLISENNPNCLDLLFSPSHCLIKNSKYWERIQENANLFISKKCKYTFSGYAIAQLQRIKSHKKYLLQPPKEKPEREKYGLSEDSIFQTSQLKSLINIESLFNYVEIENRDRLLHELDTVYADNVIPIFKKYLNPDRSEIFLSYIQNTLHSQLNTFTILGQHGYLKEEYLEEAERELKYQNALREWKQYDHWKKTRNSTRAEIEAKYGFDLKHAAHLIRLLRMGKEILDTGKVNVDRTNIDAKELKDIRYRGIWGYEKVLEYTEKMESELNESYKNSTLQKAPKITKINKLLCSIVEEYLKG